MRTPEFQAEITPNGMSRCLRISHLSFRREKPIQVFLHWGSYDDDWTPEEDKAWKDSALRSVEAYHPDDSIYEALADETPDLWPFTPVK